MRKSHCLFSMAALLAALMVPGAAAAASDCLQLQLSSPAPLCIGQVGSISATVTNSCSSRERVTASLAVNDVPAPARASFGIAGDATLSKTFSVPVPASASAGTTTLTVTLTDTAGDTTSASVDLTVESCSAL